MKIRLTHDEILQAIEHRLAEGGMEIPKLRPSNTHFFRQSRNGNDAPILEPFFAEINLPDQER